MGNYLSEERVKNSATSLADKKKIEALLSIWSFLQSKAHTFLKHSVLTPTRRLNKREDSRTPKVNSLQITCTKWTHFIERNKKVKHTGTVLLALSTERWKIQRPGLWALLSKGVSLQSKTKPSLPLVEDLAITEF